MRQAKKKDKDVCIYMNVHCLYNIRLGRLRLEKGKRKIHRKNQGHICSTDSSSISIFVQIIVGGILGNVMFLHAASITKEKHVIYLLLIFTPQFLFFKRRTPPRALAIPTSIIWPPPRLSSYCVTLLFSANRRASASIASFPFSTFLSNLAPSSVIFQAAASSPSSNFSLAQSSSLSPMLWAIYVPMVSTTSSHLKS